MALLGLGAAAITLWLAADGEGPPPRALRRFLALWCVATPCWWYLEHRLFRPAGAAAGREFSLRQAYSAALWLGVALALGRLLQLRAG